MYTRNTASPIIAVWYICTEHVIQYCCTRNEVYANETMLLVLLVLLCARSSPGRRHKQMKVSGYIRQ